MTWELPLELALELPPRRTLELLPLTWGLRLVLGLEDPGPPLGLVLSEQQRLRLLTF